MPHMSPICYKQKKTMFDGEGTVNETCYFPYCHRRYLFPRGSGTVADEPCHHGRQSTCACPRNTGTPPQRTRTPHTGRTIYSPVQQKYLRRRLLSPLGVAATAAGAPTPGLSLTVAGAAACRRRRTRMGETSPATTAAHPHPDSAATPTDPAATTVETMRNLNAPPFGHRGATSW